MLYLFLMELMNFFAKGAVWKWQMIVFLLRVRSLCSRPYLNGTRWRCPRAVSTVLCVHELACQPEDCSGHGSCVGGHCVCHGGWAGPACRSLSCQSTCGDHGLCTQCE